MAKKRRAKDWVWFNGELWSKDPNLNACSLAAQGLWIEMLCWMWQDGEEELTGSRIDLQRLTRAFNTEFDKSLAELESNGVCTIDYHPDGTLTISAGKWANQTRSRYIPAKVRQDVLSSGKCKYCESTEKLEVDHILAFANGGTHNRKNLQALCQKCNRRKKTKSVSQFRKELCQ